MTELKKDGRIVPRKIGSEEKPREDNHDLFKNEDQGKVTIVKGNDRSKKVKFNFPDGPKREKVNIFIPAVPETDLKGNSVDDRGDNEKDNSIADNEVLMDRLQRDHEKVVIDFVTTNTPNNQQAKGEMSQEALVEQTGLTGELVAANPIMAEEALLQVRASEILKANPGMIDRMFNSDFLEFTFENVDDLSFWEGFVVDPDLARGKSDQELRNRQFAEMLRINPGVVDQILGPEFSQNIEGNDTIGSELLQDDLRFSSLETREDSESDLPGRRIEALLETNPDMINQMFRDSIERANPDLINQKIDDAIEEKANIPKPSFWNRVQATSLYLIKGAMAMSQIPLIGMEFFGNLFGDKGFRESEAGKRWTI